jgi:RNA polymerase sigma-70 factor (ECF subfamily)
LYKCIAELPETDRIIISPELEDVKQAEIAKIVGLLRSKYRVKFIE